MGKDDVADRLLHSSSSRPPNKAGHGADHGMAPDPNIQMGDVSGDIRMSGAEVGNDLLTPIVVGARQRFLARGGGIVFIEWAVVSNHGAPRDGMQILMRGHD